MDCDVDHLWFPVPSTPQAAVHNTEVWQSSHQTTGATIPTTWPLTVGPLTGNIQQPPALCPTRKMAPRVARYAIRALRNAHRGHCGEAVPCSTYALGTKEPTGPWRTSNDDLPGTGCAPGPIAVEMSPPMVRGPGKTIRTWSRLVSGATIARGSFPHADPHRAQRNRNGPVCQPATFSGSRVGYTAYIDSAIEVLHQPSTLPLVRACPELNGVNRPTTHSSFSHSPQPPSPRVVRPFYSPDSSSQRHLDRQRPAPRNRRDPQNPASSGARPCTGTLFATYRGKRCGR